MKHEYGHETSAAELRAGVVPAPTDTSRASRRDAVPTSLLPSKLDSPKFRLGLVPRRVLVDSLCRSAAPLVVLSAAAGSGKTAALLEWVAAERRPVAWLRLDAADNDPVVLLVGLTAALQRVTPLDPATGEWLRVAVPPVWERVVPALARRRRRRAAVLAGLRRCPAAHEPRLLADGRHAARLPVAGQSGRRRPRASTRRCRWRACGRRGRCRRGRGRSGIRPHRGRAADGNARRVVCHGRPRRRAACDRGLGDGTLAGGSAVPSLPADERAAAVRGDLREIAGYLLGEVFSRSVARHPGVPLADVGARAPLGAAVSRRHRTPRRRRPCWPASPMSTSSSPPKTTATVVSLPPALRRVPACRARAARTRRRRRAAPESRRVVPGEGRRARGIVHLLGPATTSAPPRSRRRWTRYWASGQCETVRRMLQTLQPTNRSREPCALTLTAGWVYSAIGDRERRGAGRPCRLPRRGSTTRRRLTAPCRCAPRRPCCAPPLAPDGVPPCAATRSLPLSSRTAPARTGMPRPSSIWAVPSG